MAKDKQVFDDQVFFLASSESYMLQEPRGCLIKKRLSYKSRNDFALTEVNPPILYRHKTEGDLFLSEIILASRHVGFSIFNIKEWPLYVYVLRLKKPLVLKDGDINLNDSDFENMAWAELYPTEESAKLKKI